MISTLLKFEMQHEIWLKLAFNGQNDQHGHNIISQFFSCSSINIRSMRENQRIH